MNEVLKEIENIWNNYPAVGNTLSLIPPLITIILAKLLLSAKKKIAELLLNDKKKVPEEKIDLLIDNQIKSDQNVQNLNRMILTFALNTNIDSKVKEEIINAYQNIKLNTVEITEKTKEFINNTIEQSKELVEDIKEKAETTVKETKSIIDKYREELKE